LCGRLSLATSPQELIHQFSLKGVIPPFRGRYNIAPGESVLSIVANRGSRRAELLKWGLVPPYEQGKSRPKTLVNLRLETLKGHPTFLPLRGLLGIIPADAFYEWKKDGTKKLPYRIGLKDKGLFGLAAVFWHGRAETFSPWSTLAILTQDANDFLSRLHTRMPIVIPEDKQEAWLNPRVELEEVLESLQVHFPQSRLIAYPVSTRINSPKAEGRELIEPIGEAFEPFS
jgi:putative SOS response-associated peptidase YedK